VGPHLPNLFGIILAGVVRALPRDDSKKQFEASMDEQDAAKAAAPKVTRPATTKRGSTQARLQFESE